MHLKCFCLWLGLYPRPGWGSYVTLLEVDWRRRYPFPPLLPPTCIQYLDVWSAFLNMTTWQPWPTCFSPVYLLRICASCQDWIDLLCSSQFVVTGTLGMFWWLSCWCFCGTLLSFCCTYSSCVILHLTNRVVVWQHFTTILTQCSL